MKVYVVFDFPEISNDEQAAVAIDSLSEDLQKLASTTLYQYKLYIYDPDQADQR